MFPFDKELKLNYKLITPRIKQFDLPVHPSVLNPKYPDKQRSHRRPPTPGLQGHCPPFLLHVKISLLPDDNVPKGCVVWKHILTWLKKFHEG